MAGGGITTVKPVTPTQPPIQLELAGKLAPSEQAVKVLTHMFSLREHPETSGVTFKFYQPKQTTDGKKVDYEMELAEAIDAMYKGEYFEIRPQNVIEVERSKGGTVTTVTEIPMPKKTFQIFDKIANVSGETTRAKQIVQWWEDHGVKLVQG